MNLKERILKDRFRIADNAAKLFKQRHQSLNSESVEALIERDQIYSNREMNRSNSAKRVLTTERIIRGKDDSKEFPPNENAKTKGLSVARIHEINAQTEPKGFGTGFIIAPNILMTNNHVLKNEGEAKICVANFLYEKNEISTSISTGISYKLRPDLFFHTNEQLDYTLVYVEENPIAGSMQLNSLSTLRLIETKGKVNLKSPINIIQYPMGGIKKYTTDDNLVTDIDDKLGVIFYTTDTEPGSSGSPCFNEYWEVAALHFTAVPKTDKNGQWLTKKGELWDEGRMMEEEIEWIANAGTSISKIIENIKQTKFTENEIIFVNTILNHSIDPLNIPHNNHSHLLNQEKTKQIMSNLILNFNGNTNVYINQGKSDFQNESIKLSETLKLPNLLEKKERFDENYETRAGYDESFIPNFKVPLPSVSSDKEKELYKNFESSIPYIVPYHHFSLVINKKRRMLMWSAANVNYNEELRDQRKREDFGNGAWRLDKRIPTKYQIQADEFYDPATLVDKGHIVRRDDNCWAFLKNNQPDSIGIEYANADTFHWTNCTPQHEAFNRDMAQYKGVGLWGILENAIKEQLDDSNDTNKDYGQRACVLAGPMLNDDDPEYLDIQYPLKFWKVFAIRSESEGNLVYGFILSQEDKIEERGLEKEARPKFNRKVKALQVNLKEIERQSGVLFDNILHEFDVKGDEDSPNELENFKSKK